MIMGITQGVVRGKRLYLFPVPFKAAFTLKRHKGLGYS
jgi:hypothetical protein